MESCSADALRSASAGGLAVLLVAGWFGLLRVLEKRDSSCTEENKHQAVACRGRCKAIDNAKFVLMTCIIQFHLLVFFPFEEDRCSLETFAVFTFFFISGLWSHTPLNTKKRTFLFQAGGPLAFWCLLLLPFFMLFLSQPAWLPASFGNAWGIIKRTWASLLVPGFGAHWFLLCLIVLRLIAQLLLPLQPRARLLLAVALASLSGHITGTGSKACVGVALAALPAYIAGQVFPLGMVLERIPWSPCRCLAGSMVLLAVLALQTSDLGSSFIAGLPGYGVSGRQPCEGWDDALNFLRPLGRQAIEISKGLLLIVTVVPRRSVWNSAEFGRRSICPYLLHVVVLMLLQKTLEKAGIYEILTGPFPNEALRWLRRLGAVLFSIGLNALLASWPVCAVFEPFFQPTWLESFAMAPDEQPQRMQSTPQEVVMPVFSVAPLARAVDEGV
eukprot:TRINITY_DN15775_c0_g1_i4.p1 TRINITY_DN15775_c0_g1~~TRINITY_DN15775_c0_g1_i4.p1  ORF type:complete len:443 (-),score=75.59 TRINITY_DN15775_c0_g1_i4:53-1381(-)